MEIKHQNFETSEDKAHANSKRVSVILTPFQVDVIRKALSIFTASLAKKEEAEQLKIEPFPKYSKKTCSPKERVKLVYTSFDRQVRKQNILGENKND